MKSRVFTLLTRDPESPGAKAFARDLAAILVLSEEAREACIQTLPAIRVPQTSYEKQRRIKELVQQEGLDRNRIEQSLSVLDFFADALISEDIPESDHEFWLADLAELGWIDNDSRPAFEALVSRLASADYVSLLRRQSQQLRAQGGVLPTFNSLGITVEVRPVRTNRYRWGTPVKGYFPEIVGTTGVTSIHIGLDEGTPRDFYFQADETDLDKMISSLLAAKKDMAAFRKFLRLDSTGTVISNGGPSN